MLPDGCIDIIVDLDTGYGSVAGPMSTGEVVELPAGTRLFGVRFRPGVAPMLLDAPADALVDQHVALSAVAPRAVASVAERVAEAHDERARAGAIAELLLVDAPRTRAHDARVQRATVLIEQAHGAISIRAVSEHCGIGERQLERLFRERVGVGPKLYARIARMSRTVALADSHAGTHAELAAEGGYADEAHMVRELRALTGLTPAALRAERHVGFVQAPVGDVP